MGGIISSITGSGAKKAQATATDAATQAANADRAAALETQQQNTATLAPFVAQGGPATKYINQLLGTESGTEGNAGFDQYLKNINSDFTQNQAAKGIVAGQAATGGLNSGAAAKALQESSLNIRKSSFNDYLAALSGQQGVGLNAASAQTGVANNYQAGVTAANDSQATVTGNAALARASLNGQLTSGLIKAGATLAAGI